jgi:pimeloyl-ACP methyl ester carboxylesterase
MTEATMVTTECRDMRLSDGRRLAYAEHGCAHGQPIIYCHGAPSSRVEANLFLNPSTLAELGLRVIVPDRPGMGRSDFQANRRIVDWPPDVLELATFLGIDTFSVVGESGGSPYAAACAAFMPSRVRVVGLVGCVAPLEDPGVLGAMSAPLRMMFGLARFAPAVLRGLLRLNLHAIRRGGARMSDRMAASFPEPDRTLMQRAEIRDGFMACFEESCRQGVAGPAWDMKLIARPWGFDLTTIRVPVLLWHGERDGNVPVLHGRRLLETLPNCRGTFYPDEAHLSVPLHHHRDIFGALMAASAGAWSLPKSCASQ